MVKDKIACVSNLWTRQMHFEHKGDTNKPHMHTYDHITLLARGSFRITVEGREKTFVSPQIVYVVKNKLHFIEALEDDSLAYCIHALRTGVKEEDILEPSMTFVESGNRTIPSVTSIIFTTPKE